MKSMHYALVSIAVAACGGNSPDTPPDAAVSGGPVQLNDVSVMFPLGASGATASELLAASDSGARGTLLPSKLYDAVGHIGGTSGHPQPGGIGDAAYADLHAVAIRIDPCFAALAPDPHGVGCLNQLRVVFQEVKDVDGHPSTFDSGLHAFYQLTRPDLESLVAAIGSLRAARGTSGRLGGLAPHPIMLSEGLDGPMAEGVRKLVLQYAGAQNLTRVTELGAVNVGFTWTFAGFDVSDASAATFTPMAIPTLPAAATQQLFTRGVGDGHAAFMPTTTGADDFVPIADTASAMALDQPARQTAFDGLVRIDNPGDNSPNTTDCASCHLATPTSLLIAQPSLGLVEATDANAFVPDGTSVLASEMMPTFDAAPTATFSIHAFSYVGTVPTINQRVVNETAAIVEYLNATP